MKRICYLFVLTVALAALGSAQQGSTGSISGVVSDPSGNIVPNVAVKLISELNGESRSGATNAAARRTTSTLRAAANPAAPLTRPAMRSCRAIREA